MPPVTRPSIKCPRGAGTPNATLVYESGDILSEPSTYTATLGQAPAASQSYSANGSVPVYMEAPATTNPKGLSFEAKCGVLKFNPRTPPTMSAA